MADTSDNSVASFGALALGVLALALWMDQKKRAAEAPTEVALHQAALAAVDAARAQIHVARRSAEALSQYDVDFDVHAKLITAFTEDLPSEPKPVIGKGTRPKTFFMVDGDGRFSALRQVVDQLADAAKPSSPDDDGPTSARSILRQAIDAEGGLWTIDKALKLLDEHEWNLEGKRRLSVVGNMLAAMARDDEIKRVGRGMYTSLLLPASASPEQQVAPGVFARQASPGIWVITGLSAGSESLEAEGADG